MDSFLINHRQIFRYDTDRETVQVRCLSGTVWVTMEGVSDDYVMGAGESVDFRRCGRLVVYALADSEVNVRQ